MSYIMYYVNLENYVNFLTLQWGLNLWISLRNFTTKMYNIIWDDYLPNAYG
jgi:hypothetical protein